MKIKVHLRIGKKVQLENGRKIHLEIGKNPITKVQLQNWNNFKCKIEIKVQLQIKMKIQLENENENPIWKLVRKIHKDHQN